MISSKANLSVSFPLSLRAEILGILPTTHKNNVTEKRLRCIFVKGELGKIVKSKMLRLEYCFGSLTDPNGKYNIWYG